MTSVGVDDDDVIGERDARHPFLREAAHAQKPHFSMVDSLTTAYNAASATSVKVMMKKSIRVLHVVVHLEIGGISTWLRTLFESADCSEIQMDICTTHWDGPGSLTELFRQKGVLVHHIPVSLHPYTCLHKFRRLVRRNRYDVVHDHRSYFGGQALKAAAQENVLSRIMFHHAANDERSPGLLRGMYASLLKHWAMTFATDIMACSRAVLDGFYGSLWPEDDKYSVVYSAINPLPSSNSARATIRSQLGINANEVVLGFVGRMCHAKNPDTCIKVLVELLKLRKDIILLMIGDGPMLQRVKEEASREDCHSHVRFIGATESVSPYLQAMDIFFQPSLFEGFGLSKLEALSVGLPIICSNAPGLLEGLPPGTGRNSADALDTHAHVGNIMRVIENGCERKDYSTIMSQFSPENFYSRLMGLYRKRLKLSC